MMPERRPGKCTGDFITFTRWLTDEGRFCCGGTGVPPYASPTYHQPQHPRMMLRLHAAPPRQARQAGFRQQRATYMSFQQRRVLTRDASKPCLISSSSLLFTSTSPAPKSRRRPWGK